MAAGQGFKTFATGDVLSAADVNGYLMQGVLVFADATERNAEITSPQEGQFAYLKDTNVTTYYTGSAWANLDTTGMTNPMTTTGDTIYSSSGSTPARLGIGSTGQVLTVAGGVPSWATPASSAPTFVGCQLTKSTAQSISSGTETIITFDTETFDSDGFHSTVTNTSRITIPTGKAGKYLATAQIMSNSKGFQTQGGMRVGGGNVSVYYAPTDPTAPCIILNLMLNLSVGDYVEIFSYQGSGSAKDVLANNYTPNATYFGVTYLGA